MMLNYLFYFISGQRPMSCFWMGGDLFIFGREKSINKDLQTYKWKLKQKQNKKAIDIKRG